MRTLEEVQKDQEQMCFNYGHLLAQAEVAKLKILGLCQEAAKIQHAKNQEETKGEKDAAPPASNNFPPSP